MIGEKKIGLALSGGGYRAAAYHIGTLRALHKLNVLDKVDVISSVSGGSITAAYYVLHREKEYDKFEKEIIGKLKHNVLWIAIIELFLVIGVIITMIGFIPSGYRLITLIGCIILLLCSWYYVLPVSRFIEWAYCLLFFKGAKLDTMSLHPILAINATDLSTGNQFTFSQDRMSCYPYVKSQTFTSRGFPLSRAVMASSCIPQIFSPIKIGKKYRKGDSNIKPLLVDGGLYDNQGAHKFESSDSHYAVDYAIVSDAGNSEISSKWCVNPIGTLIMTSEILMKRIKNFQRKHNSYIPGYKKKVLYAYNDLMWKEYESFSRRFVKNIKAGYISRQVLDSHGITDDMISRLRNSSTTEKAFVEILSLVENNIGWQHLITKKPHNHSTAVKVGTNLIGLSDKKINALIEHSEWMTEVQVRLHLPFLIQKVSTQIRA